MEVLDAHPSGFLKVKVRSRVLVCDEDMTVFNFTDIAMRHSPLGEIDRATAAHQVSSWLADERTKVLIKAMAGSITQETDVHTTTDSLVRVRSTLPGDFEGVYIHRYLGPSFLMWIDPTYAVKSCRLMSDLSKVVHEKPAIR